MAIEGISNQSYREAVEKLAEKNKKIGEELEKLEKVYLEQFNRKMTEYERKQTRKRLKKQFCNFETFELSEEERKDFYEDLTETMPTPEQEAIYMQFIKEQAKGFFIILELIKEKINLLRSNNFINPDEEIKILARIKGIDSIMKNEGQNKGRTEGKLKIVDDIFGLTIIAESKETVQAIRKQISSSLMKITKANRINKPVEDENGNKQPGYSAYHDMGYLNDEMWSWINGIDVEPYRRQIEACIGEEKDSIISKEEVEEIYNKKYKSSDELPLLELHYQTSEEYKRANGIASHVRYKQSSGKENPIDIQQKYLHEDFHRFRDIPLMFEWSSSTDNIKLLGKNETLFFMYPYLKMLKEQKEGMQH